MKDYNVDYCLNCNTTNDDLTLDGEDVKLVYHFGQLLCQDCISDIEEQNNFLREENNDE